MSQNVKWVLDTTHSQVDFRVRHLMITNVNGSFKSFSAEINGTDFTTSNVNFVIQVSSVFTNDENRDGHLKSPDFFDVEAYPEIKFESNSCTLVSENNYKVTGNLTMKDVTKQATFELEFGGYAKDPWGNEKAGFTVVGNINRTEWNLGWNAALEAGGVLVSENVKINCELQFVKTIVS